MPCNFARALGAAIDWHHGYPVTELQCLLKSSGCSRDNGRMLNKGKSAAFQPRQWLALRENPGWMTVDIVSLAWTLFIHDNHTAQLQAVAKFI
jgi:hypothetical protein